MNRKTTMRYRCFDWLSDAGHGADLTNLRTYHAEGKHVDRLPKFGVNDSE